MSRMLAASGPTWTNRILVFARNGQLHRYGWIGSVSGPMNRRIGRARERAATRRELLRDQA